MSHGVKAFLYNGIKRCQKSRFPQVLQAMLENQFQPFSRLEQDRNELLEALVQEAYRWVPFYRKRLTEAGVIQNQKPHLENWTAIPPLTRLDVHSLGGELLHLNAHERGMFYSGTGGSTASPVFIAHDKYVKDWIHASYFFVNSWAGLDLGKPYFLLWASEHDLDAQRRLFHKWLMMGFLQGRRILDTAVVSPEVHRRHLNIINIQTDCHHMMAYANEAYELAQFALEESFPLERHLDAVFTTAAMLTPNMRTVIETAFGTKVLNRYGSREAGDIACECLYQSGMHINPMNLLIEVVDENNQPMPFGEEGRILLTSLHNYSMPLIRYEIGDRGIMAPSKLCRCGREWESMVLLTGRINQKIVLPNGQLFNNIFIEEAFDVVPNLKKYQILQLAPGRLHVKLRSSHPNFIETHQQSLQLVVDQIQRWTECPMEITFEQTEAFERTLHGKELTIINKIEASASEAAGV